MFCRWPWLRKERTIMRSNRKRVLVAGVAAVIIGIYAEIGFSGDNNVAQNDPASIAVAKGLKWLVSVQGADGGWGQDGGETSYVRQGERLESRGDDGGNTPVVTEALPLNRATATGGEFRGALHLTLNFILEHVAKS